MKDGEIQKIKFITSKLKNAAHTTGTSASGNEMHSYMRAHSFSLSSQITVHVNCFKPFCRKNDFKT
jgi:hypothetical protein